MKKPRIRVEIQTDSLDMSLKTLIKKMEFLTKRGYECWIEGAGDGSRKVIFEK